ncbi:hypothetical protein LIA77_02612 [Sarocladium implicatum]|nr:hypothetical protein LIA77_02612 [Sarocladium implicatum]
MEKRRVSSRIAKAGLGLAEDKSKWEMDWRWIWRGCEITGWVAERLGRLAQVCDRIAPRHIELGTSGIYHCGDCDGTDTPPNLHHPQGGHTVPLANVDTTKGPSEDVNNDSSGHVSHRKDTASKLHQANAAVFRSESDNSHDSSSPGSKDGRLLPAPTAPGSGANSASIGVIDGRGSRKSSASMASDDPNDAPVISTASQSPPMQPSVRIIGPVSPRHRHSKAAPPQQSGVAHPRPILPNGPAHDLYRGREDVTGYQPKLLQPGDGRVTATIPHKLRGNVNAGSGNFATIHMNLANTSRRERVFAAQRSSEATVAAAEKANSAARAAHRSSEGTVAAAEQAVRTGSQPHRRQSAHAAHTPPAQSHGVSHHQHYGFPARIPPPHETKSEQARLLSLLRSIHPNSIVDQLCKGLAYFGGVPGAPPPPTGAFPMSEAYNGGGALFVSWLSEIFPPVHPAAQGYQTESMSSPATPSQQPTQVDHRPSVARGNDGEAENNGPKMGTVAMPKRKRGRPKGSKSSKPRKDKGIKKGPNALRGIGSHGNEPRGDQTLIEERPREPFEIADTQQSNSQSQPDNTGPYHTPNGKKRGRPPGSKNKPKPQTWSTGVTPIASAGEATPTMETPLNRPSLHAPLPLSMAPQQLLSRPQVQSIEGHQPREQEASHSSETAQNASQPFDSASNSAFPPSHPRAAASSRQDTASLKRKLPNNSNQVTPSLLGQGTSQQQTAIMTANSQDQTNMAQSRKRHRASNGLATQELPLQPAQGQDPAPSAPTGPPVMDVNDPGHRVGTNRPEGNAQRIANQPGRQQALAMGQRLAQDQRHLEQQARREQGISNTTVAPVQHPTPGLYASEQPRRSPTGQP